MTIIDSVHGREVIDSRGNPTVEVSEPVRGTVESGEAVVILSVSLLFRRCADVEGRDPLYLRPQGVALPN